MVSRLMGLCGGGPPLEGAVVGRGCGNGWVGGCSGGLVGEVMALVGGWVGGCSSGWLRGAVASGRWDVVMVGLEGIVGG